MIAASICYQVSDQRQLYNIHMAQLLDANTWDEAMEQVAEIMSKHFPGIHYTLNLCNGPEILKQVNLIPIYPNVITYNN